MEAESGTAVDSTLAEIKKLRIIDSELAMANGDPEPASQPDEIDEQSIESSTLEQLGDNKDRPTVETLVQQQIQDQVDKIDDHNTLLENFDTLEYGANIDNKAFLQADDDEAVEIEALQPEPTPAPKEVPKAPEPEVDAAITQS
jgi:hypothetical protein